MSRSLTTIWKNDSPYDLTLNAKETAISEGEWQHPPPPTIPANTAPRFKAKNSEPLHGTAGTVVYNSPNSGLVSLSFAVPEVESSRFTVGYAGDIRGAKSGDEGGDDVTLTVTVRSQPQPHYERRLPVMTQIETVVFLMMENRSLDHVLGWLYAEDESTFFDGLSTDLSNSADGQAYHPSVGNVGASYPLRVPGFDPYEGMPNVRKQIYGSGDVPWSDEPTMSGFAQDYSSRLTHPAQVMGAYDETLLPVLSGLAKGFAVSDRWFSSVPTETDPNRAFSICGTSLGAEVNSDISETTFIDATTIFNALGANGRTWGMYWQSENPFGTGTGHWHPFTNYYFTQLNGAPNGKVDTYQNFLAELANGNAPNFCYLEPYWGGGKGVGDDDDADFIGIQGNDYHPPSWMGPGEDFLNSLYEALISSPQWKNMLFIITFDEHGGTYDHVPPPRTVAPDTHGGNTGFPFDRLGVRVPTILISPYIPAGTVFRAPADGQQYDHTSFLSTLLKWAGIEPGSAGLGDRTAVAPSFETVLSDSRRTDPLPKFTVPSGYRDQGGGTGTCHPSELCSRDLQRAHWPEFRRILRDESLKDEELKRKLRALFTPRPRRPRRRESLLARIWRLLLRLPEKLGFRRG